MQRDPFPGFLRSPLSLNRYAYSLPNPVNAVDPSGLASQVKGSEATDNDCVKRHEAAYGAYVVNEACLEWKLNAKPLSPVTSSSGSTVLLPGSLPMASPPQDEGDDEYQEPPKKDRLRSSDALKRERRLIEYLSKGLTRDQAEKFRRAIEDTKESVGRGGDDNLTRKQMEAIRDAILRQGGY